MKDKPVDVIVYIKAKIDDFCTKQDFWDSKNKDFKNFAEKIIREEGIYGLIDYESIEFQDILIDIKQEFTNKEIIDKFLKIGDLITCTRCGAELSEFFCLDIKNSLIVGAPTLTTYKYTNDKDVSYEISKNNITHINRVEVSAIPYVINYKNKV